MTDNSNYYDIQFDLNVNCYFIKHHGVYTYQSLVTRATATFNHPSWRPGINSVLDFRNCKLDLSSEELTTVAAVIRERVILRGKAKELVLVSDPLSYGIAREYLSRVETDGMERKIYSSKDGFKSSDVREYLDIDEKYIFPAFLDL